MVVIMILPCCARMNNDVWKSVKKIWGSENMNEMIKTILEQSKENYTNAAEVSLKVISKQSLLTDTEKLLGTLIQVEITNGCILAEILSLLNTPKDGDTNG